MRLAATAILLAACAGEKRPCYVGEGRDCGTIPVGCNPGRCEWVAPRP